MRWLRTYAEERYAFEPLPRDDGYELHFAEEGGFGGAEAGSKRGGHCEGTVKGKETAWWIDSCGSIVPGLLLMDEHPFVGEDVAWKPREVEQPYLAEDAVQQLHTCNHAIGMQDEIIHTLSFLTVQI